MNFLYKFGVIASLILFSSAAMADPGVVPWPTVCDSTENSFKSIKEENFSPWITSTMETKNRDVLITIWANSTGKLVITMSGKVENDAVTCIMLITDKNLQILDRPDLTK